jgi:hypothetical protein
MIPPVVMTTMAGVVAAIDHASAVIAGAVVAGVIIAGVVIGAVIVGIGVGAVIRSAIHASGVREA